MNNLVNLWFFVILTSIFSCLHKFIVENLNIKHNEMLCMVARQPEIMLVIGRAKRAPHWGVQSRFRVIYVYIYIYMYICRYVSYVKLTA